MNRRGFIAMLSALAVAPLAAHGKPRKKWYITGGRREHRDTQNDCTIEPIISYGEDRLEALANAGMTVWTEEEYLSTEADFRKTCHK